MCDTFDREIREMASNENRYRETMSRLSGLTAQIVYGLYIAATQKGQETEEVQVRSDKWDEMHKKCR